MSTINLSDLLGGKFKGDQGDPGPIGEKGNDGSPIGNVINISTSRVLDELDANKMLLSIGSAITITIPADVTYDFPIGTVVHITQDGTGQVTIASASGVTTRIRNGLTNKTAVQYSTCTAAKIAADYWYLFGDLDNA